MILADLQSHLLGFADLTTHIGDRIYAKRAPNNAVPPYIILSRVSGTTPYSLAGEIGTTQTIVQVAVWDRDPNGPWKADRTASIVRDKLSGWRGNWDDTFVSDCSLTSEPVELEEAPDDGSDNWWHSISQDYQVTHAQAVPALS